MRIRPPVHVVLAALAILVNPVLALAVRNVTVDNLSSLITYSPIPCFVSPPPNCNTEWLLTNSSGAFHGTTTSTNGTAVAQGLNILPRVTFTFQGSSILFVPGRESNATATIVVDNLPSVLVDTAHDAFSGTSLDPSSFHTISITFNPPANGSFSILSIDYFVVGVPEGNITSIRSSSSVVLTPAPLPTASTTPTSTTASTASATLAFPPTALPSASADTQKANTTRPATGTIAAISLSGVLILLIGGMGWLFAAQRRRRRHRAVMREAEILQGTRLPSVLEEGLTPAQRYSMGIRESMPPPVHYTPWRS